MKGQCLGRERERGGELQEDRTSRESLKSKRKSGILNLTGLKLRKKKE